MKRKKSYFDLDEKIFLGFMCLLIAACIVFLFFCINSSDSESNNGVWYYWFVCNSIHNPAYVYYVLLLS